MMTSAKVMIGALLTAALLAGGSIAITTPATAQSYGYSYGGGTDDNDDDYDRTRPRSRYEHPDRYGNGYGYGGRYGYRGGYGYGGRCYIKRTRYYDDDEGEWVTRRTRVCR